MITGKLPFDAKVPVALLALALQGNPVKPSARVDGVPPDLEDIILKMIARKPEDRPRDAFAVHDALEKVLGRLEGDKAPPPVKTGGLAELAHTVNESSPLGTASVFSPQSWLAAELERPMSESDGRWEKTLGDFERHIASAARKRGDDPELRRARELADQARGLLGRL